MCCVLQEEVAGDSPGGTRSSCAHLRQPEEGSRRSRQVPREDGGRCTVAYAMVTNKTATVIYKSPANLLIAWELLDAIELMSFW